jgi:glycosyltransferase involved in cell wall biosynthesis
MEPFHSWSKLAYESFCSWTKDTGSFDIVETAEYGAWGRDLVGGATPLIVRCHNPTSLLWQLTATHGLPFWLKIQDRRERALAIGADGLACPSNALAAWLNSEWGISSDQVRVIPNPIDDNLFTCGLPNRGDSSELLFVGRLEERKGVFDFANAIAPLFELYPQISARYVGLDISVPKELDSEGKAASHFIKAGLEEKFHNRVVFTGHIPVADIIRYWQGALCAVVPSRMLESFSYTVIEAMACGCPVIATRKGGPSEIISDEVDGLLVEPGDVSGLRTAVKRLVEDPDLRDTLSRNARKTVETRYGIKVVTTSIVEHYRLVIKKKTALHH